MTSDSLVSDKFEKQNMISQWKLFALVVLGITGCVATINSNEENYDLTLHDIPADVLGKHWPKEHSLTLLNLAAAFNIQRGRLFSHMKTGSIAMLIPMMT